MEAYLGLNVCAETMMTVTTVTTVMIRMMMTIRMMRVVITNPTELIVEIGLNLVDSISVALTVS